MTVLQCITQLSADEIRTDRDALQTRLQDLQKQLERTRPQPQSERLAAATHADIDSLRGEIRDLARAMQSGTSPLPRILAMTREVREGVADMRVTVKRDDELLVSVHRGLGLLLEMWLEDREGDEADDDEDKIDDEASE